MRLCARLSLDIHYICESRDHPNANEFTNHIWHPSPAPGLRSQRVPGKRLCMLCWMAVFRGDSEWEWHREQVSCSQARIPTIPPESQRIPTSLPKNNQYNYKNSCDTVTYNSLNNTIKKKWNMISIIHIIHIIAIIRIIVCFQGWYEGTIEGPGSSVCHDSNGEQEQNSWLPDCIWWHNKSSIIDAQEPNHDKVQSMTSIERFLWKRVTVNPMHRDGPRSRRPAVRMFHCGRPPPDAAGSGQGLHDLQWSVVQQDTM